MLYNSALEQVEENCMAAITITLIAQTLNQISSSVHILEIIPPKMQIDSSLQFARNA